MKEDAIVRPRGIPDGRGSGRALPDDLANDTNSSVRWRRVVSRARGRDRRVPLGGEGRVAVLVKLSGKDQL